MKEVDVLKFFAKWAFIKISSGNPDIRNIFTLILVLKFLFIKFHSKSLVKIFVLNKEFLT